MSHADDLERILDGLESVEDFLVRFSIDFDTQIVHASRLHILKRWHDYLAREEAIDEANVRRCLVQAYRDFEQSDALTERVFQVHKRAAGIATVALASIGGRHGA